jgi:alpha-galactosidase
MRNRTKGILIRSSLAMAVLAFLPAASVFPAEIPDPAGQNPDTTKPIKVYILAGQSNMLEMGNVSGGNSRHSGFYQSADPDAPKGVAVSVYEGQYDPDTDYDKLTPKTTEKVIYDGMGTDPFPKVDGAATSVARGFIEVKTTGVYVFSPGYGNSTYNVTELEGREVYRKEPGGEPIRTPAKMIGGKRYAFKTTFLTNAADSLFWVGRTDIPGTLDTVVKQQKKFPFMLGEDGNWVERDDVFFQDARLHGGWDWAPDDPNKMLLDEAKLKSACRPLTVGRGLWVGVPFGIHLGDFHDQQVLIIRTAIGNRGLAWDFRPPSSGPIPTPPGNPPHDRKWEGVEYCMMIEGVRKTLENIADVVPNYQGQGYEIAGFVWFQGHKDTGSREWAESYEQNLVNLIKDVRAAFKAPKLPVVIATVGFGGREMSGNTKTVWEAQMAVGDPAKHPEFAGNVLTVDTRNFWRSAEESPSGQGYHYNRNAETYLLIGDALGRGMVRLLQKPAATSALESPRKRLELPGLVIDLQRRCVDVESTVCLDEGMLELIACTKESKEHESIVAIEARPMHVHTALLVLGAKPGNPAMRRPVDERGTQWIDVPPRGDPVDVYLLVKNQEGKLVEHPIGKFVSRSGTRPDEIDAGPNDDDEDVEFPHTFLFAGSHLHGDGPGPRKYLSDLSGNVISISTFGDELLCLPGIHAKANDALMWQIDSTHLPEVGSKVMLRLRPKREPAPKADEPDEAPDAAKPKRPGGITG